MNQPYPEGEFYAGGASSRNPQRLKRLKDGDNESTTDPNDILNNFIQRTNRYVQRHSAVSFISYPFFCPILLDNPLNAKFVLT